MCIPRLEALRWLREYISAEIPELKDVICVVVGDPGHVLAYPSLAITPIQFNYEPNQAVETYAVYPDRVTMSVGAHRAMLQLRLTTDLVGQRYALEEKISQLFLSSPGNPGGLVGTITTCPKLGSFTADFDYDSSDWLDDDANKNKYVALILITAVIPALTVRTDAYEVTDLLVGTEIGTGSGIDLPVTSTTSTGDVTTTTPAPDFDADGVVDPTVVTELGTVTEDGDWDVIIDT